MLQCGNVEWGVLAASQVETGASDSAGLARSREDGQCLQNRDEIVKVITHLMDII